MKQEIIVNLTDPQKIVLLNALGFDVDSEKYIINKAKERIIDRYSKIPIKLENASILPGSTIIIDTNSYSLSEYFEDRRNK